MDFSFLFDPARELFSVGFNVTERRNDASFYDLLASEARLCSFVVIALDQVPQDHWFSLGRVLVALHGDLVLASWSGSMFEYLMPLLVMPNYENTLLDQTCRGAVRQQIKYGQLRGVPWGVSECGYNRTDVHLNYQYRAFGVPGLGLKRGLAEDLVIAPYATVMALMVAPGEACDNLEQLAAEGREGAYGFYEAVDYTPSRLPPRQSSVTISSFMAHHQGMSLLALAYRLLDRPMQRRFMSCPALRATDLLLQERVPNTTAKVLSEEYELVKSRMLADDGESLMRVFTNPNLQAPEVHLLSNGRYHVVVSNAGGGYSRWRELAVTRWREDATRDCWGTFIYLRDLATGEYWSAAHQPCRRATKRYEAIFTQAIENQTGVIVDPDSLFDVQIKRIHEYKRQLLNVMGIIHDYLGIVERGEIPDVPRTYVFAGKAAPGYWAAKQIIKLIHSVAEVVNHDEKVKDSIKIAFLPDYRVSLAQLIMPAADLSEQISMAGMEASGTGNMKLAMNGALTIGTYDGANIEIAEEVGEDNIYIFGLRSEEIREMQKKGSYNPRDRYDNDASIREVMDALASDRFCPNEHGLFRWIFDELVHRGDRYYHLADFPSYIETQQVISGEYRKEEIWWRKAVLNVARIAKFSSDRTVTEYARDIWHIGPFEKSSRPAKMPVRPPAPAAKPNGGAVAVDRSDPARAGKRF